MTPTVQAFLISPKNSQGLFNVKYASVSFESSIIEVARDSKECDYCNQLFCKRCIENWLILNKNCPMCHKDIRIRGASRVVKEIIASFRIKCQYCSKVFRLAEIETHEQQCGQVICDNPLCSKQLENSKYYEIVTSEGKLCVCNEVCETLAKFKRIKSKKGYLDCLKFFQSNLSSGKNYSKEINIVSRSHDANPFDLQQQLDVGNNEF